MIRMHADDINVQSRYGSGVRVMRLAEDDKLAMMARVERDNTAETAKPEEAPEGEDELSAEEIARLEAEDATRRRGRERPGGRRQRGVRPHSFAHTHICSRQGFLPGRGAG